MQYTQDPTKAIGGDHIIKSFKYRELDTFGREARARSTNSQCVLAWQSLEKQQQHQEAGQEEQGERSHNSGGEDDGVDDNDQDIDDSEGPRPAQQRWPSPSSGDPPLYRHSESLQELVSQDNSCFHISRDRSREPSHPTLDILDEGNEKEKQQRQDVRQEEQVERSVRYLYLWKGSISSI